MAVPLHRGRWVIAGTRTSDPYPCYCHGPRPCGARCRCRGRTDHPDMLPKVCCARRAAETARRNENDYGQEQW